jgi:glycosyl transferase family 1
MSSNDATNTVMGALPPRVLMPTLRRINSHAAWCSLYEFEDVIRAVDDVQLLELHSGPWFAQRHRMARTLAWRGRHRAFAAMNPGLKPVVVNREYDLFVFVCMNVWDLLYLNAIHDWQSRCRFKVCYMAEFYSGQVGQFEHLLRMLSGFDYVVQSFASSAPAVSRAIGKPCRHMPFAVDALRFTPLSGAQKRVIDVLSIGGRSAPVHESLLRLAAGRDLFYMYDTLPSALLKPTNPSEHRNLLANTAKRSRFFLVNEAKFGSSEKERQSEVGARYFEGSAAGAVLLGRAPTVSSFQEDFPWPDAVLNIRDDGSDVEAVLDSLAGKQEELERISLRNAVHSLRRHDWGHRWDAILRLIGLMPRPALAQRLLALETLANNATRTRPSREPAQRVL